MSAQPAADPAAAAEPAVESTADPAAEPAAAAEPAVESTAEPAAEPAAPRVLIPPLLVFGLPPFWCIAVCPTCDAAGFLQEDVHPLPPAPTSRCAYGHVYTLELETDHPLDADFLEDDF